MKGFGDCWPDPAGDGGKADTLPLRKGGDINEGVS